MLPHGTLAKQARNTSIASQEASRAKHSSGSSSSVGQPAAEAAGAPQSDVNATREELARHYLTQTALSDGEIAFLLGFEDLNWFFRAFHN
jgi:AraC-like DNA-binding protein